MNAEELRLKLHAEATELSSDELKRNRYTPDPITSLTQRRRSAVSRPVLTAAIIIALFAGSAIWISTRTPNDPHANPPTKDMVFHNQQPTFSDASCARSSVAESLSQVRSVADTVVVGRVVEEVKEWDALYAEGYQTANDIDAPVEDLTYLPRTLVVVVDTAVAGTNIPAGKTLDVEDLGWDRDSNDSKDWYPAVWNGNARLEVGDMAILPLQEQPGAQYSLLCSGALLIRDHSIVDTGSSDSVNREAYALDAAEVIERLKAGS